MNGASLCNSVLLHSHSISRLNSPCSFICSYSFTTSRYISISHRIRQSFRAVADKRSDGLRLFAVKKSKNGNSGRVELEDEGEEEDEDWGEFDDEVEGDEDEEDEGELLPMDKMKKWLERRPRGFGLGKKYETSIEDKLLDEIQQSWKAQAANLNKRKNDPLKSQQLKRDDNPTKGLGETQIGFRVRVTNLPRKKNVHRDLKVAFKEVSGILSITPAVSGNKKTKDPVCKGFAFVDFKTEIDANRFVDQFSGQRLAFGKVIKQIKCQVVEFSSDESVSKEVYLDNGFKLPKLPYSGREADSITDVVVEEDAFLSSGEESDYSEEEIDETEVEEDEQNHISSSIESPTIELRLDSKTKLKSEKQVVKREIIESEELETPLVSFQGNKFEEAVGETLLDDEQSEDVVAETLLDDELDGDDVDEDFEENLELMNSSLSSSEENAVDRIRMLEQKLLDKEKLLNGGAGLYNPEAKSDRVEGDKKEKKKKKKKILVKGQGKKSSKIEIPGSSKRLKVKEKALLTGVLVKYAAKVASTSE